MTISVSIIEDDPGVRTILADWVAKAEGFRLLSQHRDAESAALSLGAERPDVALVDINLPGKSGTEFVRQAKAALSQTQFVMLTVFEDNDHIFDALAAGASGYLLKRTPRDELLAAIRQVHGGGSPMTSYIARKVVTWFQKQGGNRVVAGGVQEANLLSAREKEILQLLARGFAYKEMAGSLGISMGTINTHVRRIYHKLHVSSRAEAVALFTKFTN